VRINFYGIKKALSSFIFDPWVLSFNSVHMAISIDEHVKPSLDQEGKLTPSCAGAIFHPFELTSREVVLP